jgi:hypothetical protein
MRKIFIALAALTMVFASCLKIEPYIAPEVPDSELKGKFFINEVNGADNDIDYNKYIEFFNNADEPVSMEGFTLWYNGSRTWTGSADVVVPPNGFLSLVSGRGDGGPAPEPQYLQFTGGLSARNPNVTISLRDPQGGEIDYYQKLENFTTLPGEPPHRLAGMVHMRIPDGGSDWYFVRTSSASKNAPNLSDPNHDDVVEKMQPMEVGLRITNATALPVSAPEDVEVIITATITDAPGTTITAVVKWTKDGTAQPDITMMAANDRYAASIPGQTDGVEVEWQIIATNNNGRTAETELKTITWTAYTTKRLMILQANASGNANNATLGSGLPAAAVELYNNSDLTIDFDTDAHYLHVGNDTEWTAAIKLTGSVAPQHSFLIVSTTDISSNLHRAELPTADVAAGFTINNSSFVVAVISSDRTLTADENPFGDTDFVDMLGAGVAPFAFEGTKFTDISRPRVARRVSLIDSDNNANDFHDIDYRGTPSGAVQMINNDNLYRVWPRNSAMGAWNPIAGLPKIDPVIP